MKTANKLTFLSTKFFTENKREYRITVTISLDDDCHNNDWHVSLFVRKIADAQYKEERYECLNGRGWIYCIPYEGNEHLL